MPEPNYETRRLLLVDQQLRRAGIQDEAVLDAMRTVPREEFVLPAWRESAYENIPLPIEAGQTISQPLIVAYMIEALQLSPGDRVLEIGSGSGYAAAVISHLAQEVVTIERHAQLAESCRERLQRLGYDRVEVHHADGTRGWPPRAPYDAIVVAAGGPKIPQTLLSQLAIGGRLVMPVGSERESQQLIRVTRESEQQFKTEQLTAVRFVPLIGEEGW